VTLPRPAGPANEGPARRGVALVTGASRGIDLPARIARMRAHITGITTAPRSNVDRLGER
jgi:hypothetical protein